MLCTLCLHVRDNARATPVWGLSVKCFNQFYECFYGNLHHFFSFFKLWSCITQHLIPLKKRKETVLCLLSFPQLCLSFESNSSFLPCVTQISAAQPSDSQAMFIHVETRCFPLSRAGVCQSPQPIRHSRLFSVNQYRCELD